MRVKIIADVGSNFCGSLHKAIDYVKAAADIGVDIVKFQTWTADTLFAHSHPAHEATKKKVYGLPLDCHKELLHKAKELGVEFISTPTQPEHVSFMESIGISRYKIASGDLTFTPLLEKVASTGKPVILSSGMAYPYEITRAIACCAGCSQVVVMHCVSMYPPMWNEMNLKAISLLKEVLPPEVEVGFSDHSPGYTAAVAAVALGARWIEKHITFNREINTPDAPFSLTIDEFEELVEEIRKVEEMLGDEKKEPSPREVVERFWARRGVYARGFIGKGHQISEDDLVCLRPARGIPAEEWGLLMGKIANRNINKGEPIFWDMVE
jgi:N,N'-diacetyllegionaminate synthase